MVWRSDTVPKRLTGGDQGLRRRAACRTLPSRVSYLPTTSQPTTFHSPLFQTCLEIWSRHKKYLTRGYSSSRDFILYFLMHYWCYDDFRRIMKHQASNMPMGLKVIRLGYVVHVHLCRVGVKLTSWSVTLYWNKAIAGDWTVIHGARRRLRGQREVSVSKHRRSVGDTWSSAGGCRRVQVGGQAMRDSGLPDFDQGAGAAGCHTPHSIKYCLPATIKRLKGLLVAFEAQNSGVIVDL